MQCARMVYFNVEIIYVWNLGDNLKGAEKKWNSGYRKCTICQQVKAKQNFLGFCRFLIFFFFVDAL